MDIGNLINRTFNVDFENDNNSFHLSNKKKKRYRSAFTTDQINGLEKEFKKFPYIGIVNRKAIAKRLNIPERAVKIWFQNRRMKEKKDNTHHNLDEMQHNAVNLVNDQLTISTTLLSNNDIESNSVSPQVKPKTGLNKAYNNVFSQNAGKLEDNVTSSVKTDTENDGIDNVVTSPFYQNNTVTSSTNNSNTAQFSIELLKKYKKNSHDIAERPSRPKIIPNTRHDTKETIKSNGHSNNSRNSTFMHQRHIPTGYISSYSQNTQNSYQPSCLPVGNIVWKQIDPNMSNVMPMNQFALVSNPHTLPNATTQTVNVQRRKCFCNCHMDNRQNPAAYPQENQMPQYVFAVPIHNSPAQFPYPI